MSIPYFDCHCDTIERCIAEGMGLRCNSFHLDLNRLAYFAKSVQVFAVCSQSYDDPILKADRMLNALHEEIEKNSDIVRLCLNSDDINDAIKSGKTAALISLEGCEQILSLEDAYGKGVRILHPTWNYDNAISGAAMASGRGLTEYGRRFIVNAQKMGFALDMSHISEKAFWDCIEILEKPVIAGHSNSKSICDCKRNLTDEQFKVLVSIGGGAGINLYPEFLGLGKDIDAVFAHIEHFLSLGGEEAVFLGCDLDGIPCMPNGMEGIESVGMIYEKLLTENYSEELAQDIFFNNAYKIFGRLL